MSEPDIVEARSAEDLAAIAGLFREYATAVPHVIGMEADLANLPGAYHPPVGLLLLARVAGRASGCVAYRTIDPETCELKRLYVRPEFRGLGLGRRLIARSVEEARRSGFRRMLLDTAPDLTEALHLYRAAGFREVPRYWDCPIADAIFLGLALEPGAGAGEAEGEAEHGL